MRGAARGAAATPTHPLRLRVLLAGLAVWVAALGQELPGEGELSLLSDALRVARERHAGDHDDVASALNQLGQGFWVLGRYEEALPNLEAALDMRRKLHAGDHENTAIGLTNVGNCLWMLGRHEDALGRYEEALAMKRRLRPNPDEDIARALEGVARTLAHLGRYAEAAARAEELVSLERDLHGGAHEHVAAALGDVGYACYGLGRYERAAAIYAEQLAMLRELHGDADPGVARCLTNLAVNLQSAGTRDEALARHRDALATWARLPGADPAGRALSTERMADFWLDQGRYVDALPYYEETLALQRRAAAGSVDEARSVNRVAHCLYVLERYEEALPHFARAQILLSAHSPADHPDCLVAFENLEGCLVQAGRGEDAARTCREAAEALERLGEGESVALGLRRVADRLRRHDLDGAIDIYAASLAMLRRSQSCDRMEVALAAHRLAGAEAACGRREAAILRYEEVLDAAGGADHEVAGSALRLLGNELMDAGRFDEALRRHEASVAMFRRIHPQGHLQLAWSLGRLGGCLRDTGRPQEGLIALRGALGLCRRFGSEADVQWALNELACCLQRAGLRAEALAYHRESLALCRRAVPGKAVDAMNNTAALLAELGLLPDARSLFEEALAVHRKAAPEGDATTVHLLGGLGVVLDLLGDREAGHWCHVEALAIAERLRSPLLLAASHHNVAYALRNLGRLDAAREHLAKALELKRALYGGDHPDVAITIGGLASCLEKLGRVGEAEAAGLEAVAMGERMADPNTHFWRARLGWMYLGLGRPADAAAMFREAVAQVEEQRDEGRGLLETDRNAYFDSIGRARPFDGMARAQVAVAAPEQALGYLERGRARSALDLLLRARFDPFAEALRRAREREDAPLVARLDAAGSALEIAAREVARLDASAVATPDPVTLEKLARARRRQAEAMRERASLVRDLVPVARPDAPEALRRALGARERLLVYSLAERDGILLVASRGGVTAHVLAWPDGMPVTEASVAAAVDASNPASRGHDRGVALAARARPASDTADLFRALVPSAVWKEIRGLGLVYVVPHGALHRFAFESLVVDEGRFWLDDGPPISYALSGSLLAQLCVRRDEQRRRGQRYEIVALGDPVFAAADLAPLPGTRREVEAICKGSGDRAVALLGEDATEGRLFDLAPQARFLHIATHGIGDETDVFGGSRLALTAPGTAAPGDDGFLALDELLDRWRDRLSACELVVLSACETNRGPLQKDEGPYAMPLGFLYAGCPSVIASLWRVDDASTAELFGDFYGLLREGKGKLDAFTEARKALRKKHPEPYFWAPFVYIGDPR